MNKGFSRTLLYSTASMIFPAASAAFLLPSAAHAQSVCTLSGLDLIECVEGVTVTASGTVESGTAVILGPGLQGSSATDLIANIQGRIVTDGDNEPGILLDAVDELIFTLDGTVETLGDNADAVNLTGSSVTADLGTLTTAGLNSQGVEILATDGPINLTVDAIETDGDLSGATLLRGSGDINLTANLLSTAGVDAAAIDIAVDPAVCVTLAPGECDITAAAESVTTEGFGGIGALVAAAGDTDVSIGVLRTGGDQAAGLDLSADPTACVILGAGACDTAFTVGELTTEGADSPGALVRAVGDIDANVGILETNGDRAIGLDLASDPTACAILGEGACDTSFTVGTLTTDGAGATGILVRAAGDTTGDVGILETNGDDAAGIDIATDPTACVIVGVGACDVGLVADQVTTNGDGAAAVIIDAVGAITTELGLIRTTGDGSTGVSLITDPVLCAAIGPGTCVIDTDIDEVDTDGDDSPGVEVDGGEDPIDVDVGTVDTDGDNSPGVDVEGTGTIDVGVGTVDTGGDNSPGVIIDGADDPVTLTCGTIVTAGANSPGVLIAAEGAISVDCDSVTTAGMNSDGINVDGDVGPVDVTVDQVVTTGADSDGIDVETSTGAQTIVAGGIDVSGVGSDGIVAAATGCGDIDITATGPITSADGTAILASSLCAVTVTTLDGAPVTGADAGIHVTSGTGTTITLGDAVQATDGPAIDVDGAAATIDVTAGGSINGRFDLTDEDDVLNNAGMVDLVGTSDFGAGVDVFNNMAGGVVSATVGASAIANCESFNNAGTITMVDGAPNDTLTLCGDYTGSGDATLAIDVGGADGDLLADMLVIGGDAGGSTGVDLNLLPASAVIDPDGVMIVDAGTATGTPFSLDGQTSFGLINYGLRQEGADTILFSTPDEAIFDFATLNNVGRDLWYQSADAFLACSDSRKNDFGVARSSPVGVCAQLYGGSDRYGDDDRTATAFGTDLTYSDRIDVDRRGAQVDLSFGMGGISVGVTGGYAHAETDLASGTELHGDGMNYGAFAQYGSATGLYAGVMAMRSKSEFNVSNGIIIPRTEVDFKSTGFDGEIGWRTTGFGPLLDVSAGVSHVRTDVDDFSAGNLDFASDDFTSTRGRIGARLGWSGQWAPFVGAKLFHEFSGDSEMEIASGGLIDTIESRGRGTWGRFEAGLGGGAGGGPILTGWVDVGDVKGWGVRGGFRF